jgi:curved DNA-binding protein CbpA
MSTTYSYYDLLGVTSGASRDEIKKAYRAGIRQYHPDVNHAPNAIQLLGMMNEAWEILQDPQRREKCDISIGLRGQSNSHHDNESRSHRTTTATRRRWSHLAVYVLAAMAVVAFWHYIVIGAVIYVIGSIALKRWKR